MVTTLHLLALLLYLAAAGTLAGSLAGGRGVSSRRATMAAGAGVAVHGAALASFAFAFDELPLVGLAPSLSVLGFLTAGFLLATALLREARTLGVVLVPMVVVMVGLALALGIEPASEPLAFRGPWFALHALLSFAGFAGLAVAFAAGLVYLLQFRELKGKHFGRVFHFFPALDTLDVVGRRAVVAGFASLSAGLVVGWTWAIRFEQQALLGDPKVVWGILTWLVLLVALCARIGGVRRTRRGALVAVVGFLIVVVAYVVLRLSTAGGPLFL
mgnify:CR=1 FL=1